MVSSVIYQFPGSCGGGNWCWLEREERLTWLDGEVLIAFCPSDDNLTAIVSRPLHNGPLPVVEKHHPVTQRT